MARVYISWIWDLTECQTSFTSSRMMRKHFSKHFSMLSQRWIFTMSFICLVNEACRACAELSSLLAMSAAARSMSSKAKDSSLILLRRTNSPGGPAEWVMTRRKHRTQEETTAEGKIKKMRGHENITGGHMCSRNYHLYATGSLCDTFCSLFFSCPCYCLIEFIFALLP